MGHRQRWTRLATAGLATASLTISAFAIDDGASPAPAEPAKTPATVPSTAPAQWFGDAAQPGNLYPNLRINDALRDATPRLVFNAMLTPGRPPVAMTTMHTVGSLFTEFSWLKFNGGQPRDPWVLVPDERRIRMAAVEAMQRGGALCLDIEAFPLDARHASDAEINRSIQMIAKIVGFARSQAPGLRIFLYSMTPRTDTQLAIEHHIAATTQPDGADYAWWMARKPEIEQRYSDWVAANARLRRSEKQSVSLAELFDGVCPSLYVAGRDGPWPEQDIVGLVRGHIDEARKYGKPVYPFVWPRFYQSPDPVELRTWTALIREITRHADGLVLWEENRSMWTFAATLRVRIANLLAAKQGQMTDRELYDALKGDFAGYDELNLLLGESASETKPMKSR